MEPKCCYCGEIIDVPLRTAEEAKRIAEQAARRPVTVSAPAPTSTGQPSDSSGGVVLLFMGLLFVAGYGWTAWKIHVLLGLTWTWALGLPALLFVPVSVWILIMLCLVSHVLSGDY